MASQASDTGSNASVESDITGQGGDNVAPVAPIPAAFNLGVGTAKTWRTFGTITLGELAEDLPRIQQWYEEFRTKQPNFPAWPVRIFGPAKGFIGQDSSRDYEVAYNALRKLAVTVTTRDPNIEAPRRTSGQGDDYQLLNEEAIRFFGNIEFTIEPQNKEWMAAIIARDSHVSVVLEFLAMMSKLTPGHEPGTFEFAQENMMNSVHYWAREDAAVNPDNIVRTNEPLWFAYHDSHPELSPRRLMYALNVPHRANWSALAGEPLFMAENAQEGCEIGVANRIQQRLEQSNGPVELWEHVVRCVCAGDAHRLFSDLPLSVADDLVESDSEGHEQATTDEESEYTPPEPSEQINDDEHLHHEEQAESVQTDHEEHFHTEDEEHGPTEQKQHAEQVGHKDLKEPEVNEEKENNEEEDINPPKLTKSQKNRRKARKRKEKKKMEKAAAALPTLDKASTEAGSSQAMQHEPGLSMPPVEDSQVCGSPVKTPVIRQLPLIAPALPEYSLLQHLIEANVAGSGREREIEAAVILPEDENVQPEVDNILAENANTAPAIDNMMSEDDNLLTEVGDVLTENDNMAPACDNRVPENNDVSPENENMLLEDEPMQSEKDNVVAEHDTALHQHENVLAEDDYAPAENDGLTSENDNVQSADQRVHIQIASILSEVDNFLAKIREGGFVAPVNNTVVHEYDEKLSELEYMLLEDDSMHFNESIVLAWDDGTAVVDTPYISPLIAQLLDDEGESAEAYEIESRYNRTHRGRGRSQSVSVESRSILGRLRFLSRA